MRRPDFRWLTDWDEARRHPWKSRSFLFIGFVIMFLAVAAIGGASFPDNARRIVLLAVIVAAGATLMVEPLLRQRAARKSASITWTRRLLIAAAAAATLAVAVIIGSAKSIEVAGVILVGGITGLLVALNR